MVNILKEKKLSSSIEVAKIVGIIIAITSLMIFPKESAQGIKDGLMLLYETIVPSLFPFLVLSSYVAESPATNSFVNLIQPFTSKLFRTNGGGIVAALLGFAGGYPVAAKTICQLFEDKKLTQRDAEKLFCWCINPGAAFVITAVGTFMLKNTFCGVLMYSSIIISSLITGVAVGFLLPDGEKADTKPSMEKKADIFINSVKNGNNAMISVMGWILLFSCINNVTRKIIPYKTAILVIGAVTEVSNGCKIACQGNMSLPVICALLSFGGFAVIFQVAPYARRCHVSLKNFICWKILNGALSAFICTIGECIFPHATQVSTTLTIGSSSLHLNHTVTTALIMCLMCIVFIFQVDNRRKMC